MHGNAVVGSTGKGHGSLQKVMEGWGMEGKAKGGQE